MHTFAQFEPTQNMRELLVTIPTFNFNSNSDHEHLAECCIGLNKTEINQCLRVPGAVFGESLVLF